MGFNMKLWIEERDQVAKTYDIEKFKAFYEKWTKRGLYKIPLPDDDRIIAVALRKMVYHMDSATAEEKLEAEIWLARHGSSTNLV